MLYIADRGIVKPLWDRLVVGFGLGAPAVAALGAILVGAALLTSASYFARGQHPQLNMPPSRSASSTSAQKPAGSSVNSNDIGTSTPAASPGAALLPTNPTATATPSLNTTTTGLVGGMGGGSDASGTTSSTSTDSLLPATLTVPPLDLQAADKQILSTDGTSITLN